MTDEKVMEVLALYEKHAAGKSDPSSEHIHEMCPQVRAFIADGRREKAMRWLGFMQGVLWERGEFTLHELMEHNRS